MLELTVASALILVALALAAQLLLESQRTLVLAGQTARAPRPDWVHARLLADVRASRGPTHPSGPVLELAGHPAGTVRWQHRGDTLWRTVIPSDDEPWSRPVMGDVQAFTWGWDGQVVLATLLYRRPTPLRWVGEGRPPADLGTGSLSLVAHPRGTVRWNRW